MIAVILRNGWIELNYQSRQIFVEVVVVNSDPANKTRDHGPPQGPNGPCLPAKKKPQQKKGPFVGDGPRLWSMAR